MCALASNFILKKHITTCYLHFRRAVVWLLHTIAMLELRNKFVIVDSWIWEPSCGSLNKQQTILLYFLLLKEKKLVSLYFKNNIGVPPSTNLGPNTLKNNYSGVFL